MTAATQDIDLQRKDGKILPVQVKATKKIYGGTLVATDATGYALPGADTSGLLFAGIADEQVDNTSGASGALECRVWRSGVFKMAFATPISIADIGANVFIADDNNVDVTANVTNHIFCGVIAGYIDASHAWVDIEPAIEQADVATHIADGSAAHAASAIAITDAGSYTSTTEVEAALQEIYPKIPVAITDPGNAQAIPVTRSGSVAITTTGAQTRTLAVPSLAGTRLTLSMDVDGGDCVITVASAINQTGNNTITMNDAGDTIELVAVQKAGVKCWRVVVNDGCTLSTV